MSTKYRNRIFLEGLETRLTPAFDLFYNPTADLWTVTQVSNGGDATIAVDGSNMLSVTDGSGTATGIGEASGNLRITMQSNTGNVAVTLDGALNGGLTVYLNNGARSLDLDGLSNSVGGNVNIFAGTGAQDVDLAAGAMLVAGGSVSVDLGSAFDTLAATNGLIAGSSVTFRNVNLFDDGGATFIAGTYFGFYANAENLNNELTLGAGAIIGTNFTYQGGSADETVVINDAVIGGSFNASLGTGVTGATGDQEVDLSGTTIGLGVTVTAGLSTEDTVTTDVDTEIGGNISINLGGGASLIELFGTMGGTSVNITGGINSDDVTYAMTGGNPRVSANLGGGTDTFTLGDGLGNNPGLSYLYIDFGAGVDSFINNYMGAMPFTVYLRNLP